MYQAEINAMYDQQLRQQQKRLKDAYAAELEALNTQAALTAGRYRQSEVEAVSRSQQAQKSWNETAVSQGLGSGTQSQAAAAQSRALTSQLTQIAGARQESEASTEAKRKTLAADLADALAKAQTESDYNRAMALYRQAKLDDTQKKAAAALLAKIGDYSLYAELYGLTPEQVAQLEAR